MSRALIPVVVLALLAPAWAVEPPAKTEEIRGSLVIVGSSLGQDQAKIWAKIIELAGGPGAKIAIFPTASETPIAEAKRVAASLNAAGGAAFTVPLAVKELDAKASQVVADSQFVEQVRGASGVYFVGGAQEYIVDSLRTPDGQHTPLLAAVWDMYRRGGVIVGCSAGAAVMSHIMYRDAPNVLNTMLHGVRMGKEIDYGLGFLDERWFVEQHCLVWGRFARSLVAMHQQDLKLGIGVDENTALVVTQREQLEVVGHRGAVLIDLTQATHDAKLAGFNLKNVRLSYVDRDDSLNLKTLKLSPSKAKLAERTIDPTAADFDPFFDEIIFCNDILGNQAMPDLLAKIIDNTRGEGIGLAFSGHAARRGPTRGFEFRFYRAQDSRGWFTEAFGNDNYTVSNIHLDIKPIVVSGPLYK
jgi:cyanophycinase